MPLPDPSNTTEKFDPEYRIQKIVPWKPYFPFHRLTPVAGEVGEKAGDARAFNRALKV